MRASASAALALALLAPSIASAGPWGVGKGRLYLNFAFESLDTTRLATPDGTIQSIPDFRLRQFGIYGAFGLSDRLTLVIDRVGLRRTEIAAFGEASGLEDLRTGLQVQLGRLGEWVLAARGIVQAPSGDETKGLGVLPTGSGVWEGDTRVGAGRSWREGRVYGYGELGHQFRGGGLRDALVYESQLGLWLHPRLLVGGTLRGVEPYRSASGEDVLGTPSGLGDGVTYAVYGPMAFVKLGRGFGVQAELEDAFHESNLATGLKFRLKLVLER